MYANVPMAYMLTNLLLGGPTLCRPKKASSVHCKIKQLALSHLLHGLPGFWDMHCQDDLAKKMRTAELARWISAYVSFSISSPGLLLQLL